MRAHLTDANVGKLAGPTPEQLAKAKRPADVRIDYHDSGGRGAVPGLHLRVSTADRVWAFRFKLPGTTLSKRATIGPLHKHSLAEARKIANGYRDLVKDGKDPRALAREKVETNVAEALKAEATDTFAKLASRVMAEYGNRLDARSTRHEWQRYINSDINPVFGHRDPTRITRDEIKAWVNARKVEAPVAAVRALNVLKWVYARAVDEGWVIASPGNKLTEDMFLSAEQLAPRDRTFKNAELRSLFEYVKNVAPSEDARLCVLPLIAYTGVRLDEAQSARWADIDWERRVWTIPKEYTKADRAHVVPMSRQTEAYFRDRLKEAKLRAGLVRQADLRVILGVSRNTLDNWRKVGFPGPVVDTELVKAWSRAELVAWIGEHGHKLRSDMAARVREAKLDLARPVSPWVFPARIGHDHMETPVYTPALRALLGYPLKGEKGKRLPRAMVAHDLRRTVSDRMKADLGFPPYITEEVLGHSTGKLHRTYHPSRPEETVSFALQSWADYLDSIVDGVPYTAQEPRQEPQRRQVGFMPEAVAARAVEPHRAPRPSPYTRPVVNTEPLRPVTVEMVDVDPDRLARLKAIARGEDPEPAKPQPVSWYGGMIGRKT